MELSTLKVIVTGAAGGMGAHFAHRLAEAGAQVAIADVNADGIAKTIAAAKGLRGTIVGRTMDVSKEDECIELVKWARDAMGGLNALVNNAGIIRDGLLVKKDRETGAVKKMSREQLVSVLDVNLIGATLMVREVVASMAESGTRPGVVVNMSSVSRHGNRGQTNYVAAKASLAQNTVTWSREFAPLGIRVGAVAPGMVETPMTQAMNQKARDAAVAGILVGRIGTPEDLWLAVKFVIECDYFNGKTIDVDGGGHG